MSSERYDAVVIGGGPAGLTAATYLARFKRSVAVIDAGKSRARIIPRSRNVPGFPDGIIGEELLQRLRAQAERYDVAFFAGEAVRISGEAGAFEIEMRGGRISAAAILFGTGVANVEPAFAEHDAAVRASVLRYCPICDGYEIAGRPVAILGSSEKSVNEVCFVRSYTDDITLVAPAARDREALYAAGAEDVVLMDALSLTPDGLRITGESGFARTFPVVYSCLGVKPGATLAAASGVKLAADGAIVTDAHQRTNVDGIFAAGDVVSALDQIAVAFGHAAIAATAMHNWLREREGAAS